MSTRLDVLFVVPTNVLDIAGGVPDAIEPPAKARFMASYLMRRGCGVGLFDSNVNGWTPERMAEEVGAAKPRLVVMPVYGYNPSASTQTMPSARAFSQAIKNVSAIPILMTGTHPAALPQRTLLDEPVDFVCSGEGPITAHELLLALKGGVQSDLQKVGSLWWRSSGHIMGNAPAPLIDLNQEPVSKEAWRLMNPRSYRPHHWHRFYRVETPEPYANPYSREGCPHHCDFCNIQASFRDGERAGVFAESRNSFRAVRPELFVDEMEFLVNEFGVTYFKIPDEMFGLGPHALEIARLIAERFGDKLKIWCYYRIDSCKPKHLDPLRKAGFNYLGLGIEAANSTVRSGQDKGFTDEKILDVIGRLHAAGLYGGLNYIFGLPGDTLETMEATYQLACKLNGAYGNFYCAQALPGSQLHQEAVSNGYPLPERPAGPGWPGYGQYTFESEPYYRGGALTPGEILRFRDEKHRAYYQRSEWREMIRRDSNFGEPALRCVDEWMAAISPDKLKRRLV